MNRNFNSRDESRLYGAVNLQNKSGNVEAEGKTSLICLTVFAIFVVLCYFGYKVLTQDSEKLRGYAWFWTPLVQWGMGGEYEYDVKDIAAHPKEQEDTSNQEPRFPTVTCTADKSCWIYEQPDSKSEQISYVEKGDVLLLLDIVYIDGIYEPSFYKVQCIDKYDNKTIKIGYMSCEWGKVTPA